MLIKQLQRQNESREPTRYVREPLVERRQMARRAESKEREECVGRGQPLAARRPSPSASTSCCRHSRADDHNGQCPGCGHRALPPPERSRCPSLLDTGRCGGRCQPAQRRRSLERDGERRSRERSYLGVSNVGASARLTDLPPWPLVTDRLFPFMHSWKTGRYRLRDDQSVVGEFVDSGGIVSTIMVVRASVQDGQVVTTCAPSRAVRIDDHSTEVVASDYRTERRFGSLEEMPQDVLTLYKKVVVFINNLGGRVVKVRHYPVQFPGAVCKVMENGDFLLCLKDGRVAMQKASGQLVQVTRGDKRASLTETEHSLFRNLRTDLLNFSRYAEQKSPALLPLVSGTPSPVSSPRSGPLATKEWQASTPLSRPASVRSASASAPVRRANSTVGKENVSPANATREQIKIERTSSGSVAWLRWTATGNRLRVSQNDKSTLVYRLANGKEQRLKVDDDLPNDARQMLKFMLKMADQKTE
uniref:Zyg-1 polo box domain-containing protein n=1 Tax=Plectus sambesii TaxID=2011161 RepID=A0A914XBE2_9BILA